jgi:hypothetical protein
MNPNTKNKTPQLPKTPNIMNQIIIAVFIFISITIIYTFLAKKPEDIKSLTISDVATGVIAGTVEKIEVSGSDVNVSYKDGTKGKAKKEVESSLSTTLSNYGVTSEELSSAPIEIKSESGFIYWLINILPFLLPVLIIVFFVWMLTRQVKGQGMQAFTFGQSKARITDPNDKNNRVTFKDVAGIDEAKEEFVQIVDFLQRPAFYHDIGGKIPKGCLLYGAPGTGKTLLALAAAMHQHRKYGQIILTRPAVPLEDKDELGFLPGDLNAKMAEYIVPFAQDLEAIIEANDKNLSFVLKKTKADTTELLLESLRKDSFAFFSKMGVKINAVQHYRGRTYHNTFIIVDEAQNLTPLQVKTILTRSGKNCKIVLTGDLEQIDKRFLTSENSGLAYAMVKMEGNEMVGVTVLMETVRSASAAYAEKVL